MHAYDTHTTHTRKSSNQSCFKRSRCHQQKLIQQVSNLVFQLLQLWGAIWPELKQPFVIVRDRITGTIVSVENLRAFFFVSYSERRGWGLCSPKWGDDGGCGQRCVWLCHNCEVFKPAAGELRITGGTYTYTRTHTHTYTYTLTRSPKASIFLCLWQRQRVVKKTE